MKYLLSLLLVMSSWISMAQHHGNIMKMMTDFTPDQRAIIKTKKMTLALDLNTNQQNQVLEINKSSALIQQQKMKDHIALKESEIKVSPEDRFNMMNSMLDNRISYQAKIKSILNNKQYENWKEMQKHEIWKMKKKHDTAKNKMHKKAPQ